jgi:hypothetical protein
LLYTPQSGPAEFRLEEDFLLSIPGGIVGYHSFYVILENVIRNAAKHGYAKGGHDHLDIIIEILYDPEEKININIDNNKKQPAFLFRIYDNVSKIKNDLEEGVILLGENRDGINDKLGDTFIKETGELKKENWGLVEMKISVGYLQKRNISHIGGIEDDITGNKDSNMLQLGISEKGSKAIIRAVASPLGTLGYGFYIPKPRIAGIFCKKEEDRRNE